MSWLGRPRGRAVHVCAHSGISTPSYPTAPCPLLFPLCCRWCVVVPDSRLDRELCSGADLVLNSLEQFRPEQWGLPPFPDS